MSHVRYPHGPCDGFSLVELLAVLSEMAILAGLLIPALSGVRRWLAVGESQALFQEIETACRLHRLQSGDWPEGLSSGEVDLNDPDGKWRSTVSRNMETQWSDGGLTDGFGNLDIYLLVDADGDHWIFPEEFDALQRSDRPTRLWARIAIYSLDGAGRLAVSNW